jgi:muramoyltetrapeptide carboxypeptidase
MRAATRFGPTLPDGGTIGVVAPASGFHNRSEVLRGVEWWRSRGYNVKLGAGVFDRDDYVAGDAKSRAGDLMAMFADPEVHVIQCLWGGFGSAQVLPHLDMDAVAEHPKAVVGYSDITALHVGLLQGAGLATVYGYGLRGAGSPSTTSFTRERLLAVLRHGGQGSVPSNPEDPYLRPIRGGRVTAPLVGGCLWLLMQGMGTPFEVDLEGAIFFVEDHDEPPWVIDGILTQLALAGKLAGVAGVVVSELANCEWSEAKPEWPRTSSVEDVLEQHLEPLGVPVLYGLPLGDGVHQAALPLGVEATLDADARTLTIDRPALVPVGGGGA